MWKIQNIFVTFMLDYIVDLKLDDPNEIGISVFNVIFGDIIEPPIKDIIHTDDYNKTQVIDSKI